MQVAHTRYEIVTFFREARQPDGPLISKFSIAVFSNYDSSNHVFFSRESCELYPQRIFNSDSL